MAAAKRKVKSGDMGNDSVSRGACNISLDSGKDLR
jgi:hypothetical protein